MRPGRRRAAGCGSAWRSAATAVAASALAACTAVGPAYERAALDVPSAYREAGMLWKSARPADVLERANWWSLYQDPQLDALAARVERANQEVRQAEARVRQAQAVVRQLQAQGFPALSAGLSANRTRIVNHGGSTSSNLELAADASWEPDLWGRVRRSVEAGEAQAQAQAADLESIRLAAVATLVQNYLALRVIDVQAQLLDDTVAAFNRFLQLTRNRYNAGVVGKSDVIQAEAQVRSTEAQRVDLGVQRAQLEHAIAVLAGETPASLSVPPATMVATLPAIPPGLPSELLERRPDVARAERNVAAANARIGVAQAAFYPSLTISASAGLRGGTVAKLLGSPNVFWALGTAATQFLFDAGERRALTDQAIAAHEVETAFYRQTVLNAFQEVEDQLAALRILEEEAKLQADAVASARESVQLMENRYKAGTASFLDVITVQTLALSSERTAVSILGRRLAARVQLLRALGGAWDAAALARVTEPSTAGR
jgi:NodT family efflux transporter outer membrane factor (OMF) lipoprotein